MNTPDASDGRSAAPPADAQADQAVDVLAMDSLAPAEALPFDAPVDGPPRDSAFSCTDDSMCSASDRCENALCLTRCPLSPRGSLVANATFDRAVWTDVDEERGFGPRLPRWDSLDSEACPTSGSMVINDRAAFSPPMFVPGTGSRIYWGFRARLSRQSEGPYCELQGCPDESCRGAVKGETLRPLGASGQWQKIVSTGTYVPTPYPPMKRAEFVRIACYGYGEPAGPDVHFDRFFLGLGLGPMSF